MNICIRIPAVAFASVTLLASARAQTSGRPRSIDELLALAKAEIAAADPESGLEPSFALRNAFAHAVLDEADLRSDAAFESAVADLDLLRHLLSVAALRPRRELQPLLDRVLQDSWLRDLHPLALAASDPSTLDRSAVWRVFDALAEAESETDLGQVLGLRRSLGRVPSALADRIVGEALRRLASGAEVSDLVVLLERASPRGRTRLASGLDQLRGEAETEMVRWLGFEDPALLDGWAERVFRSGRTLRLALGHLSRNTLRERQDHLVAIIADETADRGLREAAVRSMVRAAVTSDALARAVCGSGLVSERLISELATVDWPSAEPFVEVGARMAPVLPRCPGGIEALSALDEASDSLKPAIVLLRSAPPEFALATWDRADRSEREALHGVLARRSDRLGQKRLDDLKELGPKAIASRLRIGDVSVVDEWLELDERWSLRSVRSFAELAAPLIEERHVPRFVEVLRDETVSSRDRGIVCELAERRPDLAFEDVLREVYAATSSRSMREEIEAALFEKTEARRDRARAELRVPIDRISIALLDSMEQELSVEEAQLCARVLCESGAEELARRIVLKRLEAPSNALIVALTDRLKNDVVPSSGDWNPAFDERVLLASMSDFELRVRLAPLYSLRAISSSEAEGPARVLARFALAEQDERNGEFDLAAERYRDALLALEAVANWTDARFDLCRSEPADEARRSDAAFRAVRPTLCRIRAALGRSDQEGARALLPIARSLAFGDSAAEAEILALEQSIR